MKIAELKKGDIVTVESATNDYGKTNNSNGWWGARLQYTNLKLNTKAIARMYHEGKLRIIGGGFANGNIVSTTTTLEVI